MSSTNCREQTMALTIIFWGPTQSFEIRFVIPECCRLALLLHSLQASQAEASSVWTSEHGIP